MRGAGFDRLPPPPRPVPLKLRAALWLGGLRQLGCLLAALGAPFAWLVTPQVDWRSALFVGRPIVTVPGTVVSAEPTVLREGSRGLYQAVQRVRFQFAAAGGPGLEGVSWGPGRRRAGEAAMVEFPAGRPELARIEGMRGAPLDLLFVLVPFFYAFPVLAALGGSGRLKRQSRLLRSGAYVLGRLEGPDRWSGADGQARRLAERVRNLAPGTPLPMLQDPARPYDAEPVTRFSWLVAIAPNGRLVAPPTRMLLWLLVLPALAVFSNLASAPLVGAIR